MMSSTAQHRPLRVAIWPGTGLNPFVRIFAEEVRAGGAEVIPIDDYGDVQTIEADVFHIHWPEFILSGKLRDDYRSANEFLKTIAGLKSRNISVVWMVHNLQPHDASLKKAMIWFWFARRLAAACNGYMTISPATVAAVQRRYASLRSKPMSTAWLPAYDLDTPDLDREARRASLGIQDARRVYGFLGMIRPYKGIESLIATFQRQAEARDRLVIAGLALDARYASRLTDTSKEDARVKIVSNCLTDNEMSSYLSAVDVVVLPFKNYLHSSSMLYAVCGGRPVFTPETSFATAMSEEIGSGWINTYKIGDLDLDRLWSNRATGTAPNLSGFKRGQLGEAAVALYSKLRDCKRSHLQQASRPQSI